MRVAALALSLVLTGCPAEQQPRVLSCTAWVEVPPAVVTAVATKQRFLVRFFNPTDRALAVRDLELSGDPSFRLPTKASLAQVPAGACDAPGVFELDVNFSPNSMSNQSALLSGALAFEPFAVKLVGRVTGPRLEVPQSFNFGAVPVGVSTKREVVLRNGGTVGTTLTAIVESTSPQLCAGQVVAGVCTSARVEVGAAGRLPFVLTAGSAGPLSWDVTVRSSEFGTPTRTIRVTAFGIDARACELLSLPETIQVPVSPGFPSVHRLLLRGRGETCIVAGVSSSDSRVRVETSGVSFPRVLEGNDSIEVSVTALLPDLLNVSPATVSVSLSGSSRAVVEIPVAFVPSNLLPCVRATPSMLDVGEASNGCSSHERSVTLTNSCSMPVSFQSVASTSSLVWVTRTPMFPAVLSPSESTVVSVRLAPRDAGVGNQVTGELVVQLNVGQRRVPFAGQVSATTMQVDTFRQDERPRADLLFILDHSAGFQRQYPHVRAELDEMRGLLGSSLDFRYAVTTTDVGPTGPQGRLRRTDAGVAWASTLSPNFQADFVELTNMTPGSSAPPSCLEAAVRASTPPVSTDPLGTRDFWRANSSRAIVCITDNVDASPNPAALRASLASVDAGFFSYSVLGPIGSTCPVSNADDGAHVANATAFSGIAYDVCSRWGWDLAPHDVFGLRSRFFLTATPDLRAAVLEVAVNGQPLPERLPNGALVWRYDAASNALMFLPGFEPDSGESITARYALQCF